MRKLTYWVHTSVDGHISGPSGEFDWPVLGPELAAYSYALEERSDTFIYGRGVWDLMSSFWPIAETIANDEHTIKFAPIWRAKPKLVFSNTLTSADWNTEIVSGDLATVVAKLKAADGADLLLTGGSALAASLTELGLIDEFHIAIHPVVLGGGMPLLPLAERAKVKLVDSRTVDSGVMVLHYEPAV